MSQAVITDRAKAMSDQTYSLQNEAKAMGFKARMEGEPVDANPFNWRADVALQTEWIRGWGLADFDISNTPKGN